jgi:RNA polymerase sigma-70 factor (ECF subfamily)
MAISKVLARDGVEEETCDENEFTAALAGGDRRRALTILMTRHGDRIHRYALGVIGQHQLADEVRQQVFVEAYRDLDSFDGRAPVQIWLLGIARHRCLDAMKAQQRWQRRFKHDPPDDGDVVEHDPLRDLDRHRIARLISKCMSALAPAALEAVVLRYQQELSYNEVAALVGARVGTVQQRVARALPVLRKCVDRLLNPGGVP